MMCGLMSAYQMNGERLRVHDQSGLIVAQLTGWFWLGFIAAIAVGIVGVVMCLIELPPWSPASRMSHFVGQAACALEPMLPCTLAGNLDLVSWR